MVVLRLKGWGAAVKSRIIVRSVVIAGHKTGVSLEDAFWTALKTIAADRKMTVSDLLWSIDVGRRHSNLSSAIRLFILGFYRAQLSAAIEARERAAGTEGGRAISWRAVAPSTKPSNYAIDRIARKQQPTPFTR
jgi:predicted DNA-binding ribbon-helix-helix protein